MISLEEYTHSILNDNSFIFEVNKSVTLPIHHPDYYKDRIKIKLIRNFDMYYQLIEIDKESYKLSDKTINDIESIISENFNKIIEIAKKQQKSNLMGEEYHFTIKCGSILVKIHYNSLQEEEKQFLNSLFNNIKVMINSGN